MVFEHIDELIEDGKLSHNKKSAGTFLSDLKSALSECENLKIRDSENSSLFLKVSLEVVGDTPTVFFSESVLHDLYTDITGVYLLNCTEMNRFSDELVFSFFCNFLGEGGVRGEIVILGKEYLELVRKYESEYEALQER
ncbi:hypothetical protein [Pleionea sp. CnH1-48]|uniref:hypothetical protein n=1 Tax=Pleionea sp. CnH1-48 TaxID=2954494 RepID=UPI002097F555|nr:hypothetical protein [Pleionea sp. CnH1-48]MCO7226398.1 hypothetical protein [Pleionea sp. CnH1-48]